MKTNSVWTKIGIGAVMAAGLAAGCGGINEDVSEQEGAATTSVIKHVFVIAMENHDASQIYGNSSAPYINNTLVPAYAHASNFNDELPLSIPSEPHYVWMEAGTNAFSDHTFTTDNDPSSSNSTSSTAHLSTQIKNATNGVDLDVATRRASTRRPAPVRSPARASTRRSTIRSSSSRTCRAARRRRPTRTASRTTRRYSALAGDLDQRRASPATTSSRPTCATTCTAQSGCPNSNTDQAPATTGWRPTCRRSDLVRERQRRRRSSSSGTRAARTGKIPFLAVGPHVKADYTGAVSYTHSSLVKSVEHILQLSDALHGRERERAQRSVRCRLLPVI